MLGIWGGGGGYIGSFIRDMAVRDSGKWSMNKYFDEYKKKYRDAHEWYYMYIWRVSSQNGLYPFWLIWDIWDLNCWNIKKICNTFDHNFKNIPL